MLSRRLDGTLAYKDAISKLVKLATSVSVDILADNALNARFFWDIGMNVLEVLEEQHPEFYEQYWKAWTALERQQAAERRKAGARLAAATRAARRAARAGA